MPHLLEYPRAAKAGTTYHDGIHSIKIETLLCPLGTGDITVANDGNMHTRIFLYFTDKCPVSLTGIHLCTGTAVYGECGNATIL